MDCSAADIWVWKLRARGDEGVWRFVVGFLLEIFCDFVKKIETLRENFDNILSYSENNKNLMKTEIKNNKDFKDFEIK